MIREFYAKRCRDQKSTDLVPFSGRQLRDKLLIFENPVDREMAYTINVGGGLLLIDLNHLKRIINLQVGIYRRSWHFRDERVLRPRPTAGGCVELMNIESRHNEFNELSVEVYTDKSQSAAKIEIGDVDRTTASWFSLSTCCVAEILDDYLVGFWIDISDY